MHFALFVWTVSDLIGLLFWGGLISFLIIWWAYASFTDWRRSPNRWWNRRKL